MLCVFTFVVLAPKAGAQSEFGLPDAVRQELEDSFFMTEAMELLEHFRGQSSARDFMRTVSDDVQFMGSQDQGELVTQGYVVPVVRTFVSITLFFDEESDSVFMVHVVMNPATRSRGDSFIEGAFNSISTTTNSVPAELHLLGLLDLGNEQLQVNLRQDESGLGTIYSINYVLPN
jgi:hypothetical protein